MTRDTATLYLYIVVAGFAATFIWRFVGVLFAERLDADSEALVWVRLVANALMAALVARILIFPPGALENTLLSNRLLAVAAGLAAYFFGRRLLAVSVLSAAAVFLVLELLRANGLF